MRRVNAWLILSVVLLALVSGVIDGFGYLYRIANHLPLTGCPAACAPISDHPNFVIPGLGTQVSLYVHRGLDLQGGTRMVLQLDKSQIPQGKTLADAQAAALTVISNRVNGLGLSEPLIQPDGSDRLLVELPGTGLQQSVGILGKTAKMEFFKWVPDSSITGLGYRPQSFGLTGDLLQDATVGADNVGNVAVDLTFNEQGANLFGTATQAAVSKSGMENQIAIFLDLTPSDIANWADPTVRNRVMQPVNQGGDLLTNPTIQAAILDGHAQITGGNLTAETARDLVLQLKSGSLPTSVTILSASEVGATLGAQYVKSSIGAGVLGLLVIVLFLLAYYRLPGLVAAGALLLYAGMTLALYKLLNGYVTITLAGMAGFILSVGMAVDANVLIFERMKEEVRAGRTVGAAVDAGFKRAWPAIRDSNTSTLITCLVLYLFTSGGVRGFAVTLALGVALSMFTAIVVSRNFLFIVLDAVRRPTPGLIGVTGAGTAQTVARATR
ncbi:MAG: protein translocase subunit SecD [Candidatus Dormibacteria bacterium]